MSPTRADRTARLLAVAALASAWWHPVSTASAHEPDPTVVTVLDAVEPPLPSGVRIEVARSVADQLVVENTSAEPLEVLADTGEVFLRVERAGVQANLGSPTWHATSSPLGVLPPGAPRSPGPPRFATVTRDAAWGWFDHRLHPDGAVPAEDVRRGRVTVRLANWSVPMRLGGRALTVRGHLEFRPVLGALRSRLTSDPLPGGLTLQVLEGRVPGLFARFTGSGTLVISGRDGAAFARLSAAGAEINLASPTYVDDQRLRGSPAPTVPEGDSGPRWRRVSTVPTLSWLDERLAYRRGDVPGDVTARRVPTTLVRWSLPIQDRGIARTLDGVTEWIPTPGAGEAGVGLAGAWVAAGAGVLVVVLLGVAVAVRRRRAA